MNSYISYYRKWRLQVAYTTHGGIHRCSSYRRQPWDTDTDSAPSGGSAVGWMMNEWMKWNVKAWHSFFIAYFYGWQYWHFLYFTHFVVCFVVLCYEMIYFYYLRPVSSLLLWVCVWTNVHEMWTHKMCVHGQCSHAVNWANRSTDWQAESMGDDVSSEARCGERQRGGEGSTENCHQVSKRGKTKRPLHMAFFFLFF